MKISWKIRKLWHFEASQKQQQQQHLTCRYEYANVDVMASQFSIHFVHRNGGGGESYFRYENVALTLIPLWIDAD